MTIVKQSLGESNLSSNKKNTEEKNKKAIA
jgi:hypothetical protein